MAGGGGFEPPLMDPESTVLPLDDPPTVIIMSGRAGRSKSTTYNIEKFQKVKPILAFRACSEALSTLSDKKARISHNLGIVARDVT